MFTGLIEEVGRVMEYRGDPRTGARMKIAACKVTGGMSLGDSIAVNGACLTVTEWTAGWFSVDVIPETLRVTCFSELREGDAVNLERSLAVGSRLGGHIVQGHVDGCGTVRSIKRTGNTLLLDIEAPRQVMRYLISKGSIAVDGISLTVMACDSAQDMFTVSLIPHTAAATNLGEKKAGDRVHLEADLIGKYVQQLLQPYMTQEGEHDGTAGLPHDR